MKDLTGVEVRGLEVGTQSIDQGSVDRSYLL